MRIRVTVRYDYEVNADHYPERVTPTEMARLDINTDPVAMFDGLNYEITAVVVEGGDSVPDGLGDRRPGT